jgi:hypothetical protein
MVRGLFFAVMLAAPFGALAHEEHAVAPETDLVPVVTREVCTEALWGYDEIRTDCRTELRPAPKTNPALRGICTTYYGRRSCY